MRLWLTRKPRSWLILGRHAPPAVAKPVLALAGFYLLHQLAFLGNTRHATSTQARRMQAAAGNRKQLAQQTGRVKMLMLLNPGVLHIDSLCTSTLLLFVTFPSPA
jgi:hypothetical protein